MRFTVIHHGRADDVFDIDATAERCEEVHWDLLTAWNGRQPSIRINDGAHSFDVDLADVALIQAAVTS